MRGQPVVVDSYQGGVNLSSAPYAIDAAQARDVLNIRGTSLGSARKRNGFVAMANPAKKVSSLGSFIRGATQFLVAVGDDGVNTDLYSITSGGTVTSIKGALVITTGRGWDFIQAPASGGQGPTYAVNGLNPAIQWTGAGAATAWTASSGALPNGKYMVYHDNRVLIAGVETDYITRSTLYASGLADPRVWATPSAITTSFDPDDGEEITALGTVGPYAMVFKPHKTFIVTDTDSLSYRNVSDEIGCISHRSIAASDKGTFFLSPDRKVYVTDGSTITPISTEIEPALITAFDLTKAAAIFRNGSYFLSLGVSAANDVIYEYDTTLGSWWVHKISKDAIGATYRGVSDWQILDPGGASTLYAAAYDTTSIYEAFKANTFYDLDTVAGTPNLFQAYWITGWNTFGQPHIRKIMRQIRVDAKGEFDLYTATSFASAYNSQDALIWESAPEGTTTFGGSGTFGGAGTFGDAIQISERRFYTPGTGRAWSLKFLSLNGQDWELYSHTMAIDMRAD